MISKFIELDDDVTLNITNDLKLNLICYVNNESKSEININLDANTRFVFQMSIINTNVKYKQIDVNINILGSNVDCKVSANSLNVNSTKTKLIVNGIGKNVSNSKIDIQIHGILDNESSEFIGCPQYFFDTNQIQARHGLVVGKVDEKEMNYLMSRGLDEQSSKFMIISNKLLKCLEDLDETQYESHKNKIMSMWG